MLRAVSVSSLLPKKTFKVVDTKKARLEERSEVKVKPFGANDDENNK